MRSPYELFLRIVECGSITKACTVLNITQPALSRQLRKLERELGVELFDRTANGVRLTIYGQSLLEHAQTIAVADRSARADISRLRQTLKGHVAFGVSVTTSLLPVATYDVLAKLAGLRMTIVEGNPYALLKMVKKKEIEFALTTASLLDPDDSLVTRHLFFDDRLVVASRSHPCMSRPGNDFDKLSQDAWILPPTGFVREWLDKKFADVGSRPPVPQIETTSIVQMVNAVESHRFLSVLPATAIKKQLQQGLINPIAPGTLSERVDIVAVYRSQHRLSRGAELLMDSIKVAEEGSNVVPLSEFRAMRPQT